MRGKRWLFLICVVSGIGGQTLWAQTTLNIFSKEETLFNMQLQELTGLGLGVRFRNDMLLEKKINTYQFYIASPLVDTMRGEGTLNFFLGYNIAMQNYQWWPLHSHLAYVHRLFAGGTFHSWWGKILVGSSFRWGFTTVHDNQELAEKEESVPYLDMPSFLLDITPVINGTFNSNVIVARLGTVLGSFFNSSLFFKLINSPYLSFWPGVFYDTFQKNPLYKIEKDISHIGISAKFILGNLNPIEVEENEVTNLITAAHSLAFSGRIGLITNSDDIVRIIPTLPEEWAERMYYYGEVSSGFLILGMWYEKNYGMGYSIGIGLDSLGNVREVRNYDEWSLISYALYLKVKYNDAMIEPLYRGAGGKWSIVLELSQMEHGSRR